MPRRLSKKDKYRDRDRDRDSASRRLKSDSVATPRTDGKRGNNESRRKKINEKNKRKKKLERGRNLFTRRGKTIRTNDVAPSSAKSQQERKR